ncbi:hypothetical protein CUMW_267090 [Citrus unshiu]|uniref:SGNH hydrolase-type esterase domain-containing protein n=1 Tax=Citrus unshiu TaxID=55188 RepID=A0A2H5QW02_CITUN|nr:hypothetical protein CUMW_267090 [Citrus unshiu]
MILSLYFKWINGAEQVPRYFIFGDSLFDNGSNNALPAKAKANYPPYGINCPEGPTGRFSSAQLLDGFIPPFASARGENILKEYLSKCIYTVGMGNYDYIKNYLLPHICPTSHVYTPEQYATVLVRQYSQQLKLLSSSPSILYHLGARKISVIRLGLIGCTPGSVAVSGTSNSYVFNKKLIPLIGELNNNLQDANTSCPNRDEYIIWDAKHPTEVANIVLAGS